MTNDNNDDGLRQPLDTADAHGQAAMLLVESLLHGLIARSLVSAADVVEIIEIAADAGKEIVLDRKIHPAEMLKSITILDAIKSSISYDLY